jgi:hypothetical protein
MPSTYFLVFEEFYAKINAIEAISLNLTYAWTKVF